jgi:hypothetical protein
MRMFLGDRCANDRAFSCGACDITRPTSHKRGRLLGPGRRDGIAPFEALEAVRRGLEGGTLESARTV